MRLGPWRSKDSLLCVLAIVCIVPITPGFVERQREREIRIICQRERKGQLDVDFGSLDHIPAKPNQNPPYFGSSKTVKN